MIYNNIILSSENNIAENHNNNNNSSTNTEKSQDFIDNYENDENSMESASKETKIVPNDNLNFNDSTCEIQEEDTFLWFNTGCDDTSNMNNTAVTFDVANTSILPFAAAAENLTDKNNASSLNNVNTLLPSEAAIAEETTANSTDPINRSTFRSSVGISTSISNFSGM